MYAAFQSDHFPYHAHTAAQWLLCSVGKFVVLAHRSAGRQVYHELAHSALPRSLIECCEGRFSCCRLRMPLECHPGGPHIGDDTSQNPFGSETLSISDAQFETWSHPGAQTTAAATGQAVRDALNGPASLVRGRDKAIYLQGSYKNSTNIRGDSDVDVVVQLRESFGYDVSTLNATERSAFDREH